MTLGEAKNLQCEAHWRTVLLLGLLFAASSSAYMITLAPMSSFYEEHNTGAAIVNATSTALNSLLLPGLLAVLILYARRGVLGYMAILICFATWIANSVYYGYFQSPIPLAMASRASALPSVGSHILLQRISWREVALVGLFVSTLYFFYKARRQLWERGTRSIVTFPRVIAYGCIALILLLTLKGAVFANRYSPNLLMSTNAIESIKKNGFLVFYGSQFLAQFRARTPLPEFPGKINGTATTTPPTTAANRMNIFFLQIESLDARALDVALNGERLMPHLNTLKQSAIYCSNFFAQHRAGASQDSELSSLYSVIPSNHRPGFSNLRTSDLESLCEVLKTHGYNQVGFHANRGDFFNRKALFRKTGFDAFVDQAGFTGDAAGWFSKDASFFEQSVQKIRELPQPFFAYLITMQSHGPFRNYTKKSEHLNLDNFSVDAQSYLRCMSEVDDAIGHFLELLAESGLDKNSIVFVFGDHSSKIEYAAPTYQYDGMDMDEHVPLFIVTPDRSPKTIEKVCSQVDIPPTVCHLLGIPESDTWLGSSILSETEGMAILNYPAPRVIENQNSTIRIRNAERRELDFVEWSEALQDN